MKASVLLLGLLVAALAAFAQDKGDTLLCSPKNLPDSIQIRLNSEYASWRILEPTDLSSSAHDRWSAIKPVQCPGIAMGQFEGNELAYALYLVPVDHPDAANRLVAFGPRGDQSLHETVIEKWDEGGATNFFIGKIKIDDFLDQKWRRKLRVVVKDGIIMIDAARTEYEADVYYWNGGRYLHEPVDY